MFRGYLATLEQHGDLRVMFVDVDSQVVQGLALDWKCVTAGLDLFEFGCR